MDLKADLFPVIGSNFSLETMHNWKLTCKTFNKANDYKDIADKVMLLEKISLITNGLICFAHTHDPKNNNQTANFQKFLQSAIRLSNKIPFHFNPLSTNATLLAECGWKDDLTIENKMEFFKGNFPSQPKSIQHVIQNHTSLINKIMLSPLYSNPSCPDSTGNTLLHYASANESYQVSQLLLNPRTNRNAQNSNGQTPLHIAIAEKSLYIIELLLNDSLTDPSIQNNNGNTPLHLACKNSDVTITIGKILTNQKANPSIQNNYGNTPLHIACMHDCDSSIIKKLLTDQRADPNIQNQDGDTPLHRACYCLHEFGLVAYRTFTCYQHDKFLKKIGELLASPKTDPNIKNNNGNTPLHLACLCSHGPRIITKILLTNKKTNPSVQNNNGDTPLHLAYQHLYLSKEIRTCILYSNLYEATKKKEVFNNFIQKIFEEEYEGVIEFLSTNPYLNKNIINNDKHSPQSQEIGNLNDLLLDNLNNKKTNQVLKYINDNFTGREIKAISCSNPSKGFRIQLYLKDYRLNDNLMVFGTLMFNGLLLFLLCKLVSSASDRVMTINAFA